MERRAYGNTGEMISVVAFAGIVVRDESSYDSRKYVSWAIDHDVNYFDVAPAYGNAQDKLGPALKPYRDSVFLACKTNKRDALSAREELENSLKLMQTDYFDLYQLHSMTTRNDLETVTGSGGALETLIRAREEGLVRHLGFSAHSSEIAVELMDLFTFDSILYPVNFTTWFESDFGPAISEQASTHGVTQLALKGAAYQALQNPGKRTRSKCWYEPIIDKELMSLALRWTLSQNIASAIPSGDPQLWQMAVEIAEDYTPIDHDAEKRLMKVAKGKKPLFTLKRTA